GVAGATVHWYGKEDVKKNRKVGHITVCAGSAVEALNRVAEIQGKPASKPAPQVGIIMGSDSDLPVMKAAADILEKFGVAYELTI
ncbi:hypothetical protein T484DRAFT_1857418, partial [Baffinella frigidus]